jgi:hypothetical protein
VTTSHPDATEAVVARLLESTPGEFYLVFSSGDHKAVRWRVTASQVRGMVRDGINTSAFDVERGAGWLASDRSF